MINVFGLCKAIRESFPIPAPTSEINASIKKLIGSEAPDNIRKDIDKALSAKWKRDGWAWSETGAAVLKEKEKEEVIFHRNGLTFIRSTDLGTPPMCYYLPVKHGTRHPRVIWFQ